MAGLARAVARRERDDGGAHGPAIRRAQERGGARAEKDPVLTVAVESPARRQREPLRRVVLVLHEVTRHGERVVEAVHRPRVVPIELDRGAENPDVRVR